MLCPKCKNLARADQRNQVTNAKENEFYRKYICKNCKSAFFTVEFEAEENKKFKEEWERWKDRETKKEG